MLRDEIREEVDAVRTSDQEERDAKLDVLSWIDSGAPLRIYFKGAGERADNICEVQPDGNGVRPLTDLVGRPGRAGYESPTTDGEYLYFIWVEDLGDIWVMDVVEND